MIKTILLSIVLVYTFLDTVYCYRYFHHGRLGKKKEKLSEPSKYERWFTQNLDHFTPTNEETWHQRYFVNDELFDTNERKVAFLLIGGEGEASADWMTNGAWYIYGKEFKPILFQLEHRYYGESHPTKDLSTENLKYLTSQQALADLAFFIQAMNKEHELSSEVKWIVFGGSYPGSLAAWLRQKYPHLVHGAVSSSGPILAKLDFPEYLKVVQDALRTYSDDCAIAVKEGTGQVQILLRHIVGQRNINKKFKLCDDIVKDISNDLDIASFFEYLSENIAGVVQYNHDNRVSTVGKNLTVERICEIMTNQSIGPQVTRLAKVNEVILNSYNEECLDYKYDKMIEEMKNISWDAEASEGGRQWTYQTCTEFGYFQTSTYKPQIFGDNFKVDFFVQQCEDIFGAAYNKTYLERAIDRTNVLYGGLEMEVDNVVFVHGSLDPWHILGITETRSNLAPAILIKNAAHCSNMYNPSDKDTPQLKAARVEIQELIGTWLDL